jgi:hypothetical protein
LFFGVLLGQNTWVPVISLVKKNWLEIKHVMTHNRKILNFQTAVLAEPSDHNSCRPGQNSYIFSLQNPTPLREFGEKS